MSIKKLFGKKAFVAVLLVLTLCFGVSKIRSAPAPVCVAILEDGGTEAESLCSLGISNRSPSDNATGVGISDNISITFSDPAVTASSGNITIIIDGGATQQTIPCSTLTKTGSTFSTAMSLVVDENFHVNIDAFCFSNAISISNSTTWNFSTYGAISGPTTDPADGDTGVCTTRDLTLNFAQPMFSDRNNRAGTINVSCDGLSVINELCEPGTFLGSGTNTLTKKITYRASSNCKVLISNNCIHDAGDNYWDGTRIEFDTSAITCAPAGPCVPIIYSPLDDATGVAINSDLTIDFPRWNPHYTEAYDVVIDNELTIHNNDGSIYQTYNILRKDPINKRVAMTSADGVIYSTNTGPLVNGVGPAKLTIDPHTDFLPNTSYYVNYNVWTIGCSNYVVNDATTWNFTTGSNTPIKLMEKTPRNNRVNVAIDTYLEFQFDNPAFRGTGSLRVYEKDGDVLIDTIPAASTRIFGIGTPLVRVFPITGLVYNTDYYVLADEGFLNGGAPTTPSSEIKRISLNSMKKWYFRTIQKQNIPFFQNWTDER